MATAGDLPQVLRRYVERAVPSATPLPSRIRITQEGRMRMKPGGRWMAFRALEDFQVRKVGFSWRARFGVAPLTWFSVVDEYEDGVGRLEGRAWGLVRFMRATGEAAARAQAARYLSELFWTPHSILGNPNLGWRGVDGAVEVATTVGTSRVSFTFDFDEDGDIIGGWSPARPRGVGKTTVDTPWRGKVDDYATLGGVRIPRRAEVAWELPDGPFTYWEGTVTGLEAS